MERVGIRRLRLGRSAAALGAVVALTVAGMGSSAASSNAKVLPSWSPFPLPHPQSVPVQDVVSVGGDPAPSTMQNEPATAAHWPAAGASTVRLSEPSSATAGARAGSVTASAAVGPLRLAAAGRLTAHRFGSADQRSAAAGPRSLPTPSRVRVRVVSQGAAQAAGVHGMVLALRQVSGAARRSVSLSLDYAAIASGFGGGYGARLHLVRLPRCALRTPSRQACQVQRPVTASVNDTADEHLRADVALPPASTSQPAAKHRAAATATTSTASSTVVLAATSAPNSGGGDYQATSLAPSGSWSVGGNTGAFTYSYPISVPPAVGGAGPSVALSYDSASVDGRTSTTNSQASWIGDGWDYSPGFIERSYKPCLADGHTDSGDECWAGDNATLSLGGHSTQLVATGSNDQWRLAADDGSVVDELSGADNDVAMGTYWRVTTNDGTQYYFGADHLPSSVGGDGSDPSTDAAWGAPVFADDAGEPCHADTFDASRCDRNEGWRWNLDFVVDPAGNLTVYRYTSETNHYAAGTDHAQPQLLSYDRGGVLTSILYGQQTADYAAGATPAARVTFDTVQRCDPSGGFDCTTSISTANAAHWPDVPYDQHCGASGSCTNYSPTFWTQLALSKITTQVWDESRTTPAWSTVDSYDLAFAFPDPGGANPDGGGEEAPPLWLNSITRTGADTDGGGSPVTLDAVSFIGTSLPNRVAGSALNGVPLIYRYRLQKITTETGASIVASYDTSPGCNRSNPPTEDNDTTACYPVRWTPFGYTDPVLDWFTTYPIAKVDENDNASVWGDQQNSPSHTTSYSYATPAWHRDDSAFTPDKNRSWGQFRGYATVTTRAGAGADPVTQTTTKYLQGMDGDVRDDGTQRDVSVTTATGDTISDAKYWAGFAYQSTTFAADGGSAQTQTISLPWASAATATEAVTGVPDLNAHHTGTRRVDTRQLLASGDWRTARVVTDFDPDTGLPTSVDDLGQIDATGNPSGDTTPEACTTTTYASNPARNMLDFPDEVITTQGGCSDSVGDNTLAATKTYYGSSTTLGVVAGAGKPTGTSSLKTASSGDWTTLATTSYDTYGRPTVSSDPLGRATSTSYGATATARKYLPVQITTTNPMGWDTATTLDPGRQTPVKVSDPNGQVTTTNYDGLGRLTKVWLPNHRQADYPSLPSEKFVYHLGRSSFVAVTDSTLRDDFTYTADITIYDALLQARQEQTTPLNDAAGARLIVNTSYDTHGWVTATDAAFYNDQAGPSTTPNSTPSEQIPAETRTSYDGMGRPTRAALYNNGTFEWATTTAYPGLNRIDTTPPNGGIPTSSITDARGQQIELRQYHGNTASGSYDSTHYDYDGAGRQVSVAGPLDGATDPAGSPFTWTTSYDALGTITRATDPDTGTTTSSYDDDAELTATHTTGNEAGASTIDLAYSYDALGRKTAESSDGTTISTWTYDTAAKGQLDQATQYAPDGTTATYRKTITGYNANYQPTDTKITIPKGADGNTSGINYVTHDLYTPVAGNVDTETITLSGDGTGALLSPEQVGYLYNTPGLPIASGGADSYETNTIYDPHGRITRATMGAMPKQAVVTNSWDEATGRLANTSVNKEDGTAAVDYSTYTYDQVGNVTSQTDQRGGDGTSATDRQCYIYDYLDRLTKAWTDAAGTTGAYTVGDVGGCQTSDPVGATFSGPAPFWQSYRYDLAGDRTIQTDHVVPGGVMTSGTTRSTYGGLDDAHSLHTATTTSGSTTTVTTYGYDGGRTVTATTKINGTTDPDQTQHYTWNPTGTLAGITTGPTSKPVHDTAYGYDTDGQQIARTTDGATTLSIANDTIVLNTTGTATKIIREYPFPGGSLSAVRSVTAAHNYLHYQATNPQNTAVVDIGAGDQQTARRTWTPFGQERPASDNGSGFYNASYRGFLNAPQDTTNHLTSLGARQYDPNLGRFLSVDPILNPSDPQSLNGYAYADNNPPTQADPSGLRPTNDDGNDLNTCWGDRGNQSCGGGASTIGWDDGHGEPGYVLQPVPVEPTLLCGNSACGGQPAYASQDGHRVPNGGASPEAAPGPAYRPQPHSGCGAEIAAFCMLASFVTDPIDCLAGSHSASSCVGTGLEALGGLSKVAKLFKLSGGAADTVWSQGWAARGLSIEQKLGGNLPASFPTIDRFENGVATSIKSLDLTASTYQSTSKLSRTLTGYVNKVAAFNGAAFSGTRITVGQITSRALDIAIPRGAATQAQSRVLSQISAYGQSVGVNVNVTEIP